MTILHFITSLKVGGAETALYNLLEYWMQRRDDNRHAVLYIYDGPYVERIRALGIPVYQLKGAISPYDPVGWWRFKKIIASLRPDVIHSALWSANVMANIISRVSGVPLVCDLHGNCAHYGKTRNRIMRAAYRVGRGHPVAVSPSVQKSFDHIIKNPTGAILIRNGVPIEKILARAQEKKIERRDLGLDDDTFVVGSVGRLHPVKRYDVLMHAVARCAQRGTKIALVLVGDGPERAKLEADARLLSAPVIFTGEQQNPYPFYRLFDCFALSSQTEGLSIALLEALCFGLPIVTTHDSHEHPVIVDGVNGYVVVDTGCHDWDHRVNYFAHALERLFSNGIIVDSMREKNYSLARGQFCIENVVHQYEMLYKKITCCNIE